MTVILIKLNSFKEKVFKYSREKHHFFWKRSSCFDGSRLFHLLYIITYFGMIDSFAADDSSYSPFKDAFDFLVDPTLIGFVGLYLFLMLKSRTKLLAMFDDFLMLSTYFLLPLLVSIFSSYDIPVRQFITIGCAIGFSVTFFQAIFWHFILK